MRKLFPIFLAVVTSSSFAAYDSVSEYSSQPVKSYEGKNLARTLPQSKPIASTIGIALEERTNYADSYLYFNQMIYKKFYWELRGYYIHNYIVTSPPAKAVPQPSAKNLENVNGTGVVGIFGFNIPVTQKISLLPFFRLQYQRNTVSAYKDSFGNEIESSSSTYYLGLKVLMTVNEVLTVYGNYYAGFQKSKLVGKGFFTTKGTPRINSLTSTYEIGLAYKASPCWTLTPFTQLIITSNNPNAIALNPPISNSGLTSNNMLYGFKVGYSF